MSLYMIVYKGAFGSFGLGNYTSRALLLVFLICDKISYKID